MIDADDADRECHERRRAELEFVSAAYDPDTEAWHEGTATDDSIVVYRRLTLLKDSLYVRVSLTMPSSYPMGDQPLHISASLLEDGGSSSSVHAQARKVALNALPALTRALQMTADELVGAEAVLVVFSKAEEWVADDGEWATHLASASMSTTTERIQADSATKHPTSHTVRFGRRLIYSHHIISKIKRAEIKELAAYHQLTGYMKIGWPGLLIIEGREQDCIAFYDTIRRWNWQYLVVRGEQQDEVVVVRNANEEESIQGHRQFSTFLEVDDMSLVAQHCRDVGLEALFRTSMKQYDDSSSTTNGASSPQGTVPAIPYGTLVHVDHMNDSKGYRKWLQKTAMETGCRLIVKQAYPGNDYTKRPRILVGIIGETSASVSSFLKRWRTSRVDVDSRGKACLERMMTVLVENGLSLEGAEALEDMDEDVWTTTEEQLQTILHSIGGASWKEACKSLH